MPAAKKTAIEIERLLQWAYRDELPKRFTSSAEGIWDRIGEMGQVGHFDPGHGAGQRYDFGLPHPDAELIERAVALLPDLVIDWELSRTALMGELAPLLAKRDVLMTRSLRTAALITMHAKGGTRPDWHEAWPQPHAAITERGPKRPVVVGECRGRNLYTIGSYCPLEWESSPIEIALLRADYACWHHGLTLLVRQLDLATHEPLLPSAPAQPWLDRSTQRQIFLVGEPQPVKIMDGAALTSRGAPLRAFGPVTASPLPRPRSSRVRKPHE